MLKTRIQTALVLIPLMIAALFFFSAPLWAAFSALVCGLALWEFTRMVAMPRGTMIGYLTVIAALAATTFQTGWQLPQWGQLAVLAVWLVLTPLWLARRWKLSDGWAARVLGVALFFPAWLAMLAWRPDAAAAGQLLALMVLVWVADVAAYFAGKAFGKRKLAPTISPGKSWEGVIGAVLAVSAYALLVQWQGWIALPLSLSVLLAVAWLLTAVSVTGDLLESWFKRSAGIKDSSALLPGHGGVYDRIDSLIAVLAVSQALRSLAGL